MKNHPLLRSLALLGASFVLSTSASLAQPQTWVGLGTNGNWATPGNFTPGGVDTTSDVLFSGSNYLTNNFNDLGSRSRVSSLAFASGAGAFVLQGDGFRTDFGITNLSSNLQTLSFSQVLVFGSQTWDAGSAGLRVTVPVALGVMSGSIVLSITGSGNTSLENNIDELGSFPGAAARLVKLGTGTLTLAGNNSYQGDTTLAGGTVEVSQDANLGGSAATLIFNGGTLRTTAGFTMDRATTINSNGGTFDVQTGTLRQDAEISGAGRLTKIGTGTLNLTASNSYTGGTDVRRGTLFVNGGSINHPAAAMTVGRSNGDSASLIISNSGQVVSASGRVGDAAGSTGSVSVQSGTWANLGALTVGEFGSGSMLINGGVVSNTVGSIGRQAGSTSSVTVRSGAWSNSSTLNLGGSGNGALLINGGFVTNATALVGQSPSGVGSATVTSGSWSNTTLSLGYAGEGNLLVNGGTVGASVVRIGELSNSVGNATVTSGTLRSSGDLRIGEGGTGTLNLVGTGTVSVNAGAGTVTVAQRDGSTGTLNIGTNGAAGTLTAAVVNGGLGTAVVNFNHTNNLTFSPRLTGSLSVNKLGSGTTTLSGSNTYTGGTAIQNGTLAVNSGGSINHGSAVMRIGTVSGQTGTLAIGAGGSVTNGETSVGFGGTGAVFVSGAGALWTVTAVRESLGVGVTSTGSLRVESGGSVDVNSVLYLGNNSGVSGTVTVNGSGSSLSAQLVAVGRFGSGVLNLEDGGALTVDGGNGAVLLGSGDGSSGTLNIGMGGIAGVLNAATIGEGGAGTSADRTLNFNHTNSITFGTQIQDRLVVNKLGGGTTTLTASNNYRGATTIEAGALMVNGTNSGTGAVTVKSGATLGGTGSVAGAVTVENGGILAPGASAGTFSVGALILNSTSALKFELGTTSDLVAIAGNLTLDGILDVTALTGFGAGSYTLFQYGGSLTNNGLTFGTMPSGFLYGIDLSTTNYVRLTVAPTDLYWDGPNTTPNGTVNGGTGTWNNTSSNWTASNGLTNYIWNDQSTAHFAGTAGTVTVGENVGVKEMIFETTGYVLTGVGQLAIQGATLAVDAATNVVAQIGAAITGTGTLEKTGAGTITLTASNSYTGGTTVSEGVLTVADGGAINHPSGVLTVGTNSGQTAVLNILTNGSVASDFALIGEGSNSVGIVNVLGGTWTNTRAMQIGIGGAGTVNLSNGTVTTTLANIGLGSNGTVNVFAGTWSNVEEMTVGASGTGTFNLSGGLVSARGSVIGNDGTGVANVSGGTWSNSEGLGLGLLTGNGTLNLSGGTITSAAGTVGAFGVGTANVTGGTWSNAGRLHVGVYNEGTLNLSNGTVIASNVLVSGQVGSKGTLDLAGGTLRTGQVSEDLGNGTVIFGGGTLRLTTNQSDLFAGFENGDVILTNAGGRLDTHEFTVATSRGLTGNGSLTKLGSGTLTLTGTNTYTGGTLISEGTLRIGNGGNTGSITGNVTNDASLVFHRANNLTFGGEISGTGAVTKLGAGTLTLTGESTHTGGTTISAGTLRIGNGGAAGSIVGDVVNNAALVFNRSGELEFGGEISGTGTLTKLGPGVVTLTGSNSYAGGTFVRGGVLEVSGDGSISHAAAQMVVARNLGDVATLEISGNAFVESSNGVLGNATLSSGTALVSGGVWTNNGFLRIGAVGGSAGTLEVSGTGSVFNTSAVLGNGAVSSGQATVTGGLWSNSGSVTLGGASGGAGFLEVSGTGAVISASAVLGSSLLSLGQATVTGGTWSNAGSITLGGAGGSAGLLEIGDTGSVQAGEVIVASAALSAGTLSLGTGTPGGTLSTTQVSKGAGLGTVTFDGGTLVLEGDQADLFAGFAAGNVEMETEGGTIDTQGFNVSTAAGIGGTGSLTKLGLGTLTLTASNSFAGGTFLNAGTLVVGDDAALGAGTLQFGDGTTLGVVPKGNVALGNAVNILGDVSIAADDSSTLDFEGTVDLGAADRTVTFTEDSTKVCFIGAIVGTGGLSLVMGAPGLSGDVTFCGPDNNTYAGLTRVGEGIELGLEKDPGATAIAGDLQIDTGGAVTIVDSSEQINPASTVTVNGIMGILSISGTTTQTIGNLQGNGSIINTLGPAALTVNSGDFGGTILDGGAAPLGLVKASPGTLTLGGASSFRGGTALNAGLLRTTSQSALGNGPLVMNGGTLDPAGQLDVASLTWTGGVIATVLGTVTDLVNSAGDLTLGAGGGTFAFTGGAGFVPNTLYTILSAANLNDSLLGLFSGNPLLGVNPVFTRLGTSLLVNFAGSSTGPVLQNIGGPWTPVTANFFVNGPVVTGAPADNNTVNSLVFAPNSSLQVFNNLTVTSGQFDVASGTASLNGGTLLVPGDFSKTGAGTLTSGGSFVLQGAANLTGGQFMVNGPFTAPGGVNVFPGAVLGGSGQVIGNIVNNGTVAPGNSPGTLAVSGNFTQSAAGTLQMEIESPALFDRLVVGGTANLAGDLQVLASAGTLRYGQQYALLQAGAIRGQFDRILMPEANRLRGRFLSDGGTGTLLVAPTSYTLVALTRNQRSVARALDGYIPAGGGDRETVSIALDLLEAGQYPAAFDQIAPTIHESLAEIVMEQTFMQIQMLNQRMSSARLGARSTGLGANPLVYDKGGRRTADPKDLKSAVVGEIDPRWSVWTQGNGMFASVSGANHVPSHNYNGGGVLAGVDYTFGDLRGGGKSSVTTGLFGGYQGSYADYEGSGSSTMNGTVFGGYATVVRDGYYADAVVSGGYGNYKVLRPLRFSTIDRTARSSQDSGQFSAALNLGRDWQAGKFTFGPIAGGQYTYVGIAPFTERGADSLNLRLSQQNAGSLRTTLGGRVAYTWKVNERVALIPEARMFWVHEFLNGSRTIEAALDGGAGPGFDYLTDDPLRDSVFCGVGVTAQFGERVTASAYWNVDFGRADDLGQAVSLNLGWNF